MRSVLTVSGADATQGAHSKGLRLSARRRSTILRLELRLPQIHRLYQDYEILFS
jgi:hypothetical protein